MNVIKVEIKKFTVFNDLDIEFSSDINVFIGENGVGKTQLLKGMYTKLSNKNSKSIPKERYKEYFGAYPLTEDIGDIKLKKSDSKTEYNCTYIPAKDILTHSKGFLSLNDKFQMPFDKVYYDIISKSLCPNLRKVPKIGKNILPKIEKIIGGKVIVENETFFIEKLNGDKVEFALEAEGFKKIGILWQLIMNETITKDSILLWDEPESNLNPQIIPTIVEILIELSKNGVQIFIATHDYLFAKYMEVMTESDNIIFHAFYKEDDKIKCESNKEFRNLKNNLIISTFDKLLEQVFDLDLGD